jgi:hypothetical protein
MPMKSTRAKSDRAPDKVAGFVAGELVIVAGAGRDWRARVTLRRLPNGRESIHPQYDDTAIFVTFEETGISMPVALSQVTRIRGARR